MPAAPLLLPAFGTLHVSGSCSVANRSRGPSGSCGGRPGRALCPAQPAAVWHTLQSLHPRLRHTRVVSGCQPGASGTRSPVPTSAEPSSPRDTGTMAQGKSTDLWSTGNCSKREESRPRLLWHTDKHQVTTFSSQRKNSALSKSRFWLLRLETRSPGPSWQQGPHVPPPRSRGCGRQPGYSPSSSYGVITVSSAARA